MSETSPSDYLQKALLAGDARRAAGQFTQLRNVQTTQPETWSASGPGEFPVRKLLDPDHAEYKPLLIEHRASTQLLPSGPALVKAPHVSEGDAEALQSLAQAVTSTLGTSRISPAWMANSGVAPSLAWLAWPPGPLMKFMNRIECPHACGCLINVIGPTKYEVESDLCPVIYHRLIWVFERCVVLQIYNSSGHEQTFVGYPRIVDPGPPPIIKIDFPQDQVQLLGLCTIELPGGVVLRVPVTLNTAPDLILVPECDKLEFIQLKKRMTIRQFCHPGTPDEVLHDDKKWIADHAGGRYPGLDVGSRPIGMSDSPGLISSPGLDNRGEDKLGPLKRWIRFLRLRTYVYCNGRFRGVYRRRKRWLFEFDCMPENTALPGSPDITSDEEEFIPRGGRFNDDEQRATDSEEETAMAMGEAFAGHSALNPPPR